MCRMVYMKLSEYGRANIGGFQLSRFETNSDLSGSTGAILGLLFQTKT